MRALTPKGLTDDEAGKRLEQYGANLLTPKKRSDALTLLLTQFKSPLILILMFAGSLSFFLGDPLNAFIILAIILISSLIGFCRNEVQPMPSKSYWRSFKRAR